MYLSRTESINPFGQRFQIYPCLFVIRINSKRFKEMFYRFTCLTQHFQNNAQIVMRTRIVRIDSQRFFIMFYGFFLSI